MSGIHTGVYIALIIAVGVIRLIFLFYQRDGHHVDETWSYGFANSYYESQIYGYYDGEGPHNIGEWVTGDTFGDYITVSEDHRFAFDSVLYNSNEDLSPPLYIILLHFVSSLFPGRFSWWFAFSISLLAYVPSLILIYLISHEFTDSRFCGLLTLAYYVFSGCGTSNFLFLRIYHLFTLFALWLFWLMIRIVKNDKDGKYYYFPLLLVPAILGFLTHYYFLVIAFSLTLFGVLCLLLKKRIRDFFRMGIWMLLSVGAFFAIYPSSIRLLLPYSSGDTSGTGYYTYPYSFDLEVANMRFFRGTLGFYIPFNVQDLIMLAGIIVFGIVMVLLVVFLFRNENWMKKLLARTKSICVKVKNEIKTTAAKLDKTVLIAVPASILYLLIIPYSATIFHMGFTERYFFGAMTLFCIAYVSVVGVVIERIVSSGLSKAFSRSVTAVIITLMIAGIVSSNISTQLFRLTYMEEKELTDVLEGNDCYIVFYAHRDLVWLCPVLRESGDLYLDDQKMFLKDDYEVPELHPGTMLVIVDAGFLSEEQKEQYESDDEIGLADMEMPQLLMTAGDLAMNIGEETGLECISVGEYKSFIGMIDVYRLEE